MAAEQTLTPVQRMERLRARDRDAAVTRKPAAAKTKKATTPQARQEVGADGYTIGQRLKILRLQQGLSQRDLGSPGVTYAYISRVEAGTRIPSTKAIRKLAPKLGVAPNVLEFGEEIDPTMREKDAEIDRLKRLVATLERRLERQRQRADVLSEELRNSR